MVGAQADPSKQKLNIRADEAISPEDMQRLIARIQVEAKKLEPGWVAAIDLRGVWVSDPNFYEQIKRLQKALIDLGVRKVGTLIDNYVIQILLGQAGSRTNANMITKRFYTEQEWNQFLDG